MAWNFGRQPDPDPQKEEELKAQSKKESDEFIAQLTTSFESKLESSMKPLRDEITALKSAQPAPRTADPEPNASRIPSVMDDEETAFNARLGPLAAQTVLLNARLTETEVLSEISSQGWGHIVPAIREVLSKQTPLQTKAGDGYRGYVENVAAMLIGRAAREKGLKFDGNKQTFFLEDASSSGNQGGNKLRTLEAEANDGKIDILHGRSVAEWAKNMGIENPESLLEGSN
jgi:hypothetical protein